MLFLVTSFLLSFLIGFAIIPYISDRLKQRGIVGRDVHTGHIVPEMGGISLFLAYFPGVMLLLFGQTYFHLSFPLIGALAALLVGFMLTLIGVVDDLLELPKVPKVILPLIASIPLIVLRQGHPVVHLPWLGTLNLGLWYTFLLIPLGITVASNLANMVEGVNGLGAGLGIIYYTTMTILALMKGNTLLMVLFVPFIGALLAFLYYNGPPARIFPGDTGTFLIGGLFAAGVIAGNFESPAALLFLPLLLDFVIKAWNGFPSKGWAAKRKGHMLYWKGKPKHILHVPLLLLGPMTQSQLLLSLLIPEFLMALVVLGMYM